MSTIGSFSIHAVGRSTNITSSPPPKPRAADEENITPKEQTKNNQDEKTLF